jgi:hypothetical protein
VDTLQAEHPQAVGREAAEEEERRVAFRAEMIAHIVLFRPRATLSDIDRAALIDALRIAVSGIPEIRRTRIGRRLMLHRPGYETAMAEHYEYSAILEFDSEADLRAYLDHPAHTDLGNRLFNSADAVLAYDFVCAGENHLDVVLNRN